MGAGRCPATRRHPTRVDRPGLRRHTRTPSFRAALDEVLADVERCTVAVMCSESVWWRCHRRLVADVVVLAHGVEIRHLMPDGSLRPHPPAPGARLDPGGSVVWDVA